MKKLMILHDGGSLKAFESKGNLSHYVENLYNPGNHFTEVHIIVFKKEDLKVKLNNPTLRVHLIFNVSLEYFLGRTGRYIGLIISTPIMLLQVYLLAKKINVSIIRARNAYAAGFIAVTIGRLLKIPSVVSLGGDNRIAQKLLGRHYGHSRILSFILEEYSLLNANRVFCSNEFTKQYAMKLGVAADKSTVINHRIDTEILSSEDKSSRRNDLGFSNEIIGLFIGRFEKDKQVDVIIEAIPKVLLKNKNIHFHFLGDGSMKAELKSRVRDLDIEKYVHFHGYQNRQNISKFLTASDFIVIPMSGFVIYEAAFSKTPIIAFDVEWHSEFVINNETGVLVRDRDSSDLAAAIDRLSNDEFFRDYIAKNAHSKFLEECNQESIINKEIEQYKIAFNSKY